MRKQFTETWNTLGSNVKSVLISLGAIALATGLLFLSKTLFPGTDFSQLELVIITAISGFVVNLLKNFLTLK